MSDLLVRLKLDDKGLDTQLKGVSSKFKTAAAGIAAIAIPIAAISAVAKMVDGLSKLGEQAIRAAGDLQDTSAQLGVSAERLQELRLVAGQAGVEVGEFDKALSVLNKTLGQASLGQGEFEKVAKAAGVSLRDQQGHIISTSDTWDALTEKIQSGALSQNQAIGLATAAFGREGGKMVEVLRQTAEEQQKVIDTARKFGAIISNELVARADLYEDELSLIQQGTKAMQIQRDLSLAPLTLQWEELKNEIAAATLNLADFLGLLPKNSNQLTIAIADANAELATMEAALSGLSKIQILAGRDKAIEALIEDKKREIEGMVELRQQLEDASWAPVLRDRNVDGVDVDSADALREKEKAAAAEIALVTAVFEEKARLIQLEAEQELDWATVLAEERERFHQEELAQEMEWANVLAAERERVMAEEVFAFEQKEGLLTQARKEGAEARAAFDKMAAGQQVATTIGALATITAAVAQHSKKAFELNKLAAIANAIVNTAQGATKALAQGGFAGIAMAAAVIAAGAVQIAAIKKTQFQGGGAGTTPSAVGTRPVINDQPVGGTGTGKSGGTIRVEGIDSNSLFTGRALRELLERIQEAQKDGGRLVIA